MSKRIESINSMDATECIDELKYRGRLETWKVRPEENLGNEEGMVMEGKEKGEKYWRHGIQIDRELGFHTGDKSFFKNHNQILLEKPSQKILTSAGRFDIIGPQTFHSQPRLTDFNPSIDTLFKGEQSYLWSMIYILAFTDSIISFIEEDEVKQLFNRSSMDLVTDTLYRPLHQENWNKKKPCLELKKIEKVLNAR